jgi:hypothetical protein
MPFINCPYPARRARSLAPCAISRSRSNQIGWNELASIIPNFSLAQIFYLQFDFELAEKKKEALAGYIYRSAAEKKRKKKHYFIYHNKANLPSHLDQQHIFYHEAITKHICHSKSSQHDHRSKFSST